LGMLRSVHYSIVATPRRYNPRMSLPVYVDAYSGYKANELPRDFTVDEDLFEIAEVEDRWFEPLTARRVRVQVA
jgi:hypothetical protein